MVTAGSEPWVWTSGPVRCDDRMALVACVVNPSARLFHYGVSGFVERHDDREWTRVGQFGSSLDFWGGLGRISPPGERLAVRLIGLGAAPGGTGAAEYVDIDSLDSGRYRVGHRETVIEGQDSPREAVGEFVVPDALPADAVPIEIASPAGVLLLSPFLLAPGGGRLQVRRQEPPGRGASTPESRAAFASGLHDTLTVQRWSDGGWTQPVIEVDIHSVLLPEFDTTETFVDLPALQPGPYRFSCKHTSGPLTRVAWVIEALGSLHA